MTDTVKKCLLMGLNYIGTDLELNGCINDSENLRAFLIGGEYLKETDDIVMMNEHQQNDLVPYKANILKQLDKLVKFCNENKDKKIPIVLAYSGHGYHVRDTSGDEKDGWDEVLCPIDFNTAGFIVDDYLFKNFICKLPSNVTLVMLIDACHSGTVMDLKYNYMVRSTTTSYSVNASMPATKCNCILISGSKDSQTSADAYLLDPNEHKKEYQGAMTASFIANYKDGITYKKLVTNMRTWLKAKKFDQIPQLSSGKHININSPFVLSQFK